MSKRLPRHKRADPKSLSNLRLMSRDREIIKAVNDYQAMNIAQIELRFFNSPSPAYGRLAKLFHHGYLDRHFITQVTTAPAASPIVYTITKLGAEVLAGSFGYGSEDFNFASAQVLNWKTLQHILAVGDFRVAFEKACEKDHLHLVEWLNESHFRAKPDYVNVPQGSGKSQRKPVYPDSYVSIKTPMGTARFFIEVDRGTEGISQFKSQIEIYQEYISSGKYQERFKAASLRILIVTNTQRRAQNLMKATGQVARSERYWFTSQEQISPQSVITKPIWQKLTDDEFHALVE